ncbi:hypothetical protein NE237_030502 [Protea cynaroides]|uniref:Reverse transcriptase RNase H-like domain-containing protein n=1 Tax=Protea cynaroides TaxID=273540 RepID=A0A9Q0GUC5_9MAGN|nr:hypothetical protein NE237_030502 [Protea cynaroides]
MNSFSAGNFLGFLIHQRGIEVDKNKARAIIEAKPPQNKNELQQLLGQVNFLRHPCSNSSPKGNFSGKKFTRRRSKKEKGISRVPCYHATDQGQATEVISAARNSIGSLLAQNNDQGAEQAVYYLSRVLTPVEQRYTPIEKLCLTLYFSSQKWRVYMLPVMVFVICQTDIIKYLLSRPIMSGRLGKWAFALMEFTFQYRPQRAVKGQALASFLASHPCLDIDPEIGEAVRSLGVSAVTLTPWRMYFDGSKTKELAGAGVIILSPMGRKTQLSFQLYFPCTNNQAEYEAMIIGMEILLELRVSTVEIIGDSPPEVPPVPPPPPFLFFFFPPLPPNPPNLKKIKPPPPQKKKKKKNPHTPPPPQKKTNKGPKKNLKKKRNPPPPPTNRPNPEPIKFKGKKKEKKKKNYEKKKKKLDGKSVSLGQFGKEKTTQMKGRIKTDQSEDIKHNKHFVLGNN